MEKSTAISSKSQADGWNVSWKAWRLWEIVLHPPLMTTTIRSYRPACIGTHLGCTLLAVREGLLCLPYDCLDGETYEQFAVQDIRLLSKEQAQLLLNRLQDTYTRLLNVLADAQAFGLVRGDNTEEVGHE